MRHGEVPMKDLQKLELKFMSIWPNWNDAGFEIILEVWKKNKTNPEKGREFVVNLKYLPPFTLFRELELYIKKDQREERVSETEGLTKFDQVFKKWSNSVIENNILLLDIINLRLNKHELFWNLVYRFTLDRRDHMFLLPYEMDLFPELFKEEEKAEEYKLKVRDVDDEQSSSITPIKERSKDWEPVPELEERESDGEVESR